MFDEFGSGCRHLAPYGRRGRRKRLLLRPQPARSKQNTNAVFLMPSVFALGRPLVDGNLGYSPFANTLAKVAPGRRLSTRWLVVLVETLRTRVNECYGDYYINQLSFPVVARFASRLPLS
jgi:hypothetical protein